MGSFSYAVVSSVLHDTKAIEAIFSKYEPFFAALSGQRVELEPAKAAATTGAARPPFFFILTGGTEGIVLDYLSTMARPTGLARPARKPFPLVLIAHPHHNSLPAALEIAARAKQDGGSAILILMKSPLDTQAGQAIGDAVLLCRAILAMRNSRIGAVGKPSDWLVASSQPPESVASTWGTTVEPIPLEELQQGIDKIRASEGMGAAGTGSLGDSAALFLENADYKREPTPSDMYKSDTIYRALRSIAADRHLDGLTLRCFDLVSLDRSTGCFALSQLSDEGIDAGCEGDIPSALALRWMRLLSGKAAWMANPADIS
jgi:L-fucose isomerase-like protein